MKKTVFIAYRFVPVLLLTAGLGGTAIAQRAEKATPKADKGEVNVRIIERNGDDLREVERTYHFDGMTDPERDRVVTKLIDSLKAARKDSRKRQMTIIVEDNDGDRSVIRERINPRLRRVPGDAYVQRNARPRADNGVWNDRTWQFDYRRSADSLADRLSRFRFQFPRDFDRQLARPFEDWARNATGKPSTVRGLDVYPNNPDRNQLNIRFTTPAKGNVEIVVTNPKGKEVARRVINDFSGEFVGQIDLGKKSQGTYFVTVTQNEDGAVKRIVVD